MHTNTNFSEQPVYDYLLKLLDKEKIGKLERLLGLNLFYKVLFLKTDANCYLWCIYYGDFVVFEICFLLICMS
jgi:hypothetical protein